MRKADTYGARKQLSDEDVRLWRTAMREVRPLSGHVEPALLVLSECTEDSPSPEAPAKGAAREILPVASERSPTPLPGLKHGATPGLDKRRAERLRRGQLAVEARIDLHGMTQEAARGALDGFVASSYAMGRRMLLVITGKGIRPDAVRREDAVGILRQAVPRWLNERPNRERVLAFTHAQPKDGGTGALYVLLRRRRDRQ